MISVAEALIISIFFISFLQGIFTVVLGAAVYLIAYQRPKTTGKRHWLGLGIIIVMYLASTAHFIMVFYQDIVQFGGRVDASDRNIRAFGKFGLAQIAIGLSKCIIADSLLIWRAWVIYNRDCRVIILPCFLVLGLIVTSYGFVGAALVGVSHLPGNNLQAVFTEGQHHERTWQVILICLSTATNVFLTSMMAVKLLLHHRAMKRIHGFSMLVFESLVIIESGALYALAWIIFLVLSVTGSNAAVIALDIISQLAGLVPALIIVTIAAGLSPVSFSSEKQAAFATSARNAESDIRFAAGVSIGGQEVHRSESTNNAEGSKGMYV